MYINHDDLVALATGPTVQGEQILKSMDREIVSYKRVVSFCLQLVGIFWPKQLRIKMLHEVNLSIYL